MSPRQPIDQERHHDQCWVPPGAVITAKAAAYVKRPVDSLIEQGLKRNHSFIIVGPPQSGRSSLSLQLATKAHLAGWNVVTLSASSQGVAADLLSRLGSSEAVSPSSFDAFRAVEQWRKTADRSLLVIDDFNADGFQRGYQFVRSLLEQQLFSANEGRLLVVLVATERAAMREPRVGSQDLSGHVIATSWLTQLETHEVWKGCSSLSGRRPLRRVADRAFEYFAGQPYLTHAYLDEIAQTGQAPDLSRPSGAYHLHLRRIAALVCVEEADAKAVLERRKGAHGGKRPFNLYGLRVLDNPYSGSGQFSCKFYAEHLPDYVERTLDSSELETRSILPLSIEELFLDQTDDPRSAFLSYVHEDMSDVSELQVALESEGISTWRDSIDLRPGSFWREEIRTAVRTGGAFIACFSSRLVARQRSYMWEELALAVEELRQRPNDQRWFFPVKLDECEIPDFDIGFGRRLADIQAVEVFRGPDEMARLLREVSRFV